MRALSTPQSYTFCSSCDATQVPCWHLGTYVGMHVWVCMCGYANQHATSRDVCAHAGRQVTSLGMPGNAAYLQQYGGAMPAGVMGALAGQPGDWQRGSGVPTGMAWPYRGGAAGGGNDIGGQAANTGNAHQNQLSYQMLVNASLYQQSQGFAAGNSSGLVDMGLLPTASGYAGTGGMQVC